MENSVITAITQFIKEVGFPIFVAVWMLIKQSKDSQAMTTALNEVKTVIATLTAKLDDDKK